MTALRRSGSWRDARAPVALCAALLAAASSTWAAAAAVATTVEDVIARHAAARGGQEAWRKVQTMVWIGRAASAAPGAHAMRFVAQLQRPNRERFDIQDPSAQLTRVFDGKDGWKLRPAAGSGAVQPFSPEEAGFAREEFVIDGPLLDHDAKGVQVRLEGVEAFDGRQAYRLSLKLPSGAARNLWIDTRTNLVVRYDRPSGSPMQRGARIATYYRDYRDVGGLRIPHRIEVGVAPDLDPPPRADALVIDRVLLNPRIDPAAFSRPVPPALHGRAAAPAPHD